MMHYKNHFHSCYCRDFKYLLLQFWIANVVIYAPTSSVSGDFLYCAFLQMVRHLHLPSLSSTEFLVPPTDLFYHTLVDSQKQGFIQVSSDSNGFSYKKAKKPKVIQQGPSLQFLHLAYHPYCSTISNKTPFSLIDKKAGHFLWEQAKKAGFIPAVTRATYASQDNYHFQDAERLTQLSLSLATLGPMIDVKSEKQRNGPEVIIKTRTPTERIWSSRPGLRRACEAESS